jgi:hypothetical protein
MALPPRIRQSFEFPKLYIPTACRDLFFRNCAWSADRPSETVYFSLVCRGIRCQGTGSASETVHDSSDGLGFGGVSSSENVHDSQICLGSEARRLPKLDVMAWPRIRPVDLLVQFRKVSDPYPDLWRANTISAGLLDPSMYNFGSSEADWWASLYRECTVSEAHLRSATRSFGRGGTEYNFGSRKT